MAASMMRESQQSGSVRSLSSRQALTLHAGEQRRELHVQEGLLWVTVSARAASEQPQDVWLRPGQRFSMAPGQTVVVEGWAEVRFDIVPPLCRAPALGLWRRLAGQLSASAWQGWRKLSVTSSVCACP